MKQSKLSSFLSLISYKEEKKIKKFYIPEINEDNEDTSQKSSTGSKESSSKKNIKKNKYTQLLRKVIPIPKKTEEVTDSSQQEDNNKISKKIDFNLNKIKQDFNFPENKDISIREIVIAGKSKAFIAFIDGMVDRITINNFILRPLLNSDKFNSVHENNLVDYVANNVLEIHQIKKITSVDEANTEILSGNTIICIDSCDSYITCETKGYEKRSVEKPVIEAVVKGSQEAFTENMRTNITLIRRIIKSKDLTSEFFKMGERTNSQTAIMYLKGVVNPALVKEVKRRLTGINADYISGDGILEQFIEDSPNSIVSTMISTERPDRTAAHIIEGKIAIICEGTPFVLIIPATIASLLHTSEEASIRWQFATFIRFVRLFALFISSMLPGLYVALTNFHREMIPTELLIAIGQARENVPFPTLFEVLLMELSFELIREAGLRIPGIIGNTIGIIGALILGQAAVQANLVSPMLIIIIAFTGLGNFALPNYTLAFTVRIARITFILAGALMGFIGVYILLICFSSIILNTKSFGVPLLTTISPKTRRSFDFIVRHPSWKQELRPDYLNTEDVRRQPKISRQWAIEDADVSDTDDMEGKDDTRR